MSGAAKNWIAHLLTTGKVPRGGRAGSGGGLRRGLMVTWTARLLQPGWQSQNSPAHARRPRCGLKNEKGSPSKHLQCDGLADEYTDFEASDS